MPHPRLVLGAAVVVLTACTDPVGPTSRGPSLDLAPATPQAMFERYVAMGTSNSQGVVSAGIDAAGQRSAWPAQLATRVGMPFTQPLFDEPGCNPPLVPPLAANLALVAAFSAFGAGDDLVTGIMTTCAPLLPGIVPPENNVAVSGADVHDALTRTPELAMLFNTRVGTLYSRVLAPGQTQVTAMVAQSPTFVSVELAANDVLPASTGRIAAMTPFASWQADYDQVIGAVRSTGARAVLVGLPANAARFPSIRRAREFFNEWPDMLAMGVTVSLSCYFSSNYLFIPGYVLSLLQRSPTRATCADVPGTADYVLTPNDITAINARMAQINAHIQARATESGYAYFALSALYDLPKINFDMYSVLFSNEPFGPYISLDGVHPSARGQAILANAAVQAINAKYGFAIP